MISEPMTVATDYLLAVAGAWLGGRLWLDGRARGERAPRWLALAFLAMAAGALLGGTAHGFARQLGEPRLAAVWLATTLAIGVAGFFLLAAAAAATLGERWGRALLALAALKLAVYGVWTSRNPEFYWVILDYGSAMLATAALMLVRIWRRGRRGRDRAAGPAWIVGGIALSLVAAAVQAARVSPHPLFNHNDLYHVMQLVALVLLYRGGRRLDDAPRRRP